MNLVHGQQRRECWMCNMAKIEKIWRRSSTSFYVMLDQEIWDSFAKTERQTYAIFAKDEVEAYNQVMKGIWHEQSRTR